MDKLEGLKAGSEVTSILFELIKIHEVYCVMRPTIKFSRFVDIAFVHGLRENDKEGDE